MRRNSRVRNNDSYFKNLMFWSGLVLLIAVVAFGITYAIYNNKVKSEARVSQLNSRSIGELVPSLQTEEEIKSASFQIGKTVEEVKSDDKALTIKNDDEIDFFKSSEDESEISIIDDNESPTIEEDKTEDVKRELNFKMPVEGDIIREFAKENLVYSETLKEWVTHNGIDIKAIKTAVVKASESGEVKSIKNDPRYGITVIIEHQDGFNTVYSNLLTAEFVSEGEKVEKGQSIGTVGASANFELADEPHLHFELWKDGEAIDPQIYIK